MDDSKLIEIMESLTGWQLHHPGTTAPGYHTANSAWNGPVSIKEMCERSAPNWYAYMGLMDTYDAKFLRGETKRFYDSSFDYY